MRDNSWLQTRHNAIHMTIRDVDCENFDVEAFIAGLKEMNVSAFSFFCGGYVTTYPTKLPEQRVSPWLTDDLTGRLVETAHRQGIKALAMIDLGQLPRKAGDTHPDWCARDEKGEKIEIEDRLYATCPNSAFRLEFTHEMVREIITNYDVDAIKFGGASYGFGGTICHCERCRTQYKAYSGGEKLPTKRDWSDPNWVEYFKWQNMKTVETVHTLRKLVKDVCPDMPVLGNATAFGDPKWTMSSPLDMEKIISVQDVLQVEVQERRKAQLHDAQWQSLTFPAETANFMSHATDKVTFVIPSYFLAWPWRRSAMPYAEQKAYIAQIVANGGSPMVNLSGGPMKVHEDQRGFRAIREVYRFAAEHREDLYGDASVARIALLYSQDTLTVYGRDDAEERYVNFIRGFEQAMNEAHLPYDILSIRGFTPEMAEQYDVVLLANMAVMSEEEADRIRGFAARGGSVIATFETSLYDGDGNRRDNFLLADLFGTDAGRVEDVDKPELASVTQMTYQVFPEPACEATAILKGHFEGTSLIPAYGRVVQTKLWDAHPVMTLSPTSQVFPEGFAYPLYEGENKASFVARRHPAGGRVIYFPCEIDNAFFTTRVIDFKTEILSAIEICERRQRPMRVHGPKTVMAVLRTKNDALYVHLINLTGGDRYFDEFIPVSDITVSVANGEQPYSHAVCLSNGRELTVGQEGAYATAGLDRLVDYDIIKFTR